MSPGFVAVEMHTEDPNRVHLITEIQCISSLYRVGNESKALLAAVLRGTRDSGFRAGGLLDFLSIAIYLLLLVYSRDIQEQATSRR